MRQDINDSDLEFADARLQRTVSLKMARRVAAIYNERLKKGRITKPMALFVARCINAAVTEDR